jgi:hypothetical protein
VTAGIRGSVPLAAGGRRGHKSLYIVREKLEEAVTSQYQKRVHILRAMRELENRRQDKSKWRPPPPSLSHLTVNPRSNNSLPHPHRFHSFLSPPQNVNNSLVLSAPFPEHQLLPSARRNLCCLSSQNSLSMAITPPTCPVPLATLSSQLPPSPPPPPPPRWMRHTDGEILLEI